MSVEVSANTLTKPRKCGSCKKTFDLTAPASQWAAFESGQLIQRALLALTEDERELLISGMCGRCFDALFEGMEE